MGIFLTQARVGVVLISLHWAVHIRLFAVRNYGPVIHEFDPWFNYRATEYMVANGWQKFQAWYDEGVWYPLGRHVGSTTYPGLQLTAYALHSLFALVKPVDLNTICVYIPAGFGAVASALTGLLAYEATGNANSATAALFIMAIIPAHLMRSVAGGYDNESIAVSAIVGTFYLWVRSLRSEKSWPYAVLCGLCYVYLVAAWGGYVFALNMIGIHAAGLVLSGRFSRKLWKAYSIWFIIGTSGAVFGPARYLVGWQPFQSLEQLGPTVVFFGLLIWQATAYIARQRKMNTMGLMKLRAQVIVASVLLAAVVAFAVLPAGFFGPLSARVRGLFVKHTKTGNPLVDSVAEHQATPSRVYWAYFHVVCFLGPPGCLAMLYKLQDAKIFVILYALVAYYFSGKMIRLVLLLAPAGAVTAGHMIGLVVDFTLQAYEASGGKKDSKGSKASAKASTKSGTKKPSAKADSKAEASVVPSELKELYEEQVGFRRVTALILCTIVGFCMWRLTTHAFAIAPSLSEPQIMLRGKGRDGRPVIIDDFREAYWWLRDNTPEDARVMAWWDYGYQINGVANRTSIADGNTWNHEHIALLGKCLVSNENVSHAITKHLADYVLIWTTRFAGMYSDDIAKSPHMARIAGSVYPDIKPAEFYVSREGTPSKMMQESVLWRLHHWKLDPKAEKPLHFEEAYTTRNRMVRIYKVLDVDEESKRWRKEHGPGYPPALQQVLAASKPFEQIHGF
uniref:dolichyl-diphosphooligosaccharide--protein glycotransferase n=1 Tax=Chrysotila carterae TaxID=13221 RepID=A0A7S4F3N1_CHRCT